MNKQEIFDAVQADDPGWRELVNESWGGLCLEDKLLILILKPDGGGSGSGGAIDALELTGPDDAQGSQGNWFYLPSGNRYSKYDDVWYKNDNAGWVVFD